MVNKMLKIKPEDNPFKNVFTDEMNSEERWTAIKKLDLQLTEGLSTILSDPDLGVRGSLELGEEFEKYRRMIKDLDPPTKKALLIQSGIDGLMEEEEKRLVQNAKAYGMGAPKISCRIGCSACCHRLIGVTSDEAVVLASELRKLEGGTQVSPDTFATLERQAKFGLDQQDAWKKQHKEKTKCVFLSQHGACRIYEYRPTACRTLQVLSDPYLCSPKATRTEGEEPEHLWFPLTEALASAAATDNKENYQPLARAVLDTLSKDLDRQIQSIEEATKQIESLQQSMQEGFSELAAKMKPPPPPPK